MVTVTTDMGTDQLDENGDCIIVCRGWGVDQPGVAQAFIQVVTRHECHLLDIAQFLLEGSLLFTFVLSVKEKSMNLMQEMAGCAKERGMKLDFHFPKHASLQSPESRGENQAVISVVSTRSITPELLYDLDGVLCDHGCVVHEIEHRSDNKRQNNGEYNKVSMRVGCPRGLKPAAVLMGAPDPAGGDPKPGLQRVAWGHRAEVTIRWWDAMNRPNGKSLVVFGLSHVLCPYDVLDEILRVAGIDVDKAIADTHGMPLAAGNQKKVSMLKGKSAELLNTVCEKLEFAPGTKLVCAALKRMGFTLAVLTNTGCREVLDKVKRHLGIDYIICRDVEEVNGVLTGSYSGEFTDISFRKSDLLKLMAEREQIEFRNVIAVGEPLKGLKRAEARLVMETFGPMVYFNSNKLKDLTIVLYLLGFHGTDIRALRKRRWEEGPGQSEPVQPTAKRCLIKVTSRFREPGQLRKIFAPLQPLKSMVEVQTVKHCSLQDGGMCLGLQLTVQKEDPGKVMTDMVFACNQDGFQVEEVQDQADLAAEPRTTAACWRHYFQNRFVITLVQRPLISTRTLHGVLKAMSDLNVNCVKVEKLSSREFVAVQLIVNIPQDLDPAQLKRALTKVSSETGGDIAFQMDDLDRFMRRLVIFDMDSTLIQQDVIDELAKCAGVEKEAQAISECMNKGGQSFSEALKAFAALLKGQKYEPLISQVKESLIFTPGAKKLCSTLRKLGYKMAVVSGTFLPFAREVQDHLQLDYAYANSLEVDEASGCFTGALQAPIDEPARKRALLAMIANVEGCDQSQTIAVGDGDDDLPMLNAAGLGIAFCAKPRVQEATQVCVNQKDLGTVLFLLGVSEYTVERLTAVEAVSVEMEDDDHR